MLLLRRSRQVTQPAAFPFCQQEQKQKGGNHTSARPTSFNDLSDTIVQQMV
jgi:hypothetical protein